MWQFALSAILLEALSTYLGLGENLRIGSIDIVHVTETLGKRDLNVSVIL